MKNVSKLGLAAVAIVSMVASRSAMAVVVGADDFSDANGTAINGKAADVGGGAWSGPGGQTIVNGVLDTAQVGQHEGSFLDLTGALGAGQTLTLNFVTAESADTTFAGGGSYAGISLYVGGSEKLFVGDPGGDQAMNGWALDGFAGGGGASYTGLTNESVIGTFTYNFDTGLGTLSVTDGTTIATTTHNYDPGLGLNRLRIQSGGSDSAGIAVDSFSVSTAVPEPATLSVAAVGAAIGIRRRRRA